jgi:hypothetical protein
MPKTHAMQVLVFLAGAVTLAPACAKRGPDASTASSQARVVVANQTGASLALHVSATDQATGDVALNDTITLQQGDVHVVGVLVPPSAYMFSAELLGDAAGRAFPASGSARVTLVEGATTAVQITGLPAAGGGGSTIRIGVGDVPAIDGVQVALEGGSQGTLKVDVHASTRGADGLTLFWSGAGLSGTVKGSSTLTLPAATFAAAAAPTGSVVLHVVVQDASGLANSADVLIVTSETGPRGSIVAGSGGDQVSACLAAQVKCAASCDAGLGLGAALVTGGDTGCLGACGVGFAACLGH